MFVVDGEPQGPGERLDRQPGPVAMIRVGGGEEAVELERAAPVKREVPEVDGVGLGARLPGYGQGLLDNN